MARYTLLESFGVDQGELDGMSPAQCFVLGFEYHIVDEKLREHLADGRGFYMTIRTDNRERIGAKLDKAGIVYRTRWLNDDRIALYVDPGVLSMKRYADVPRLTNGELAKYLAGVMLVPGVVVALGIVIIEAIRAIAGR